MVFDERFDRLLWLMMAGDKKGRDKIAYFINTMPQEIYNQVNGEITKFGKSTVVNPYDDKVKKGEFTDVNDTTYSFEFDVSTGSLNLLVSRWKGCYLEEKFRLFLSANTRHIMEGMKVFDKIYVGSFTAAAEKLMWDNDDYYVEQAHYAKEYYLVKTPIGFMIELIEGDNSKLRTVDYRRKCPSAMYVTDFSSPDRINNLVRSRKKNNSNLGLFNKQ